MRGSVLDALFPRTRQGILAVTLGHPEKSWYASELARRLSVAPSSVQRDLKDLTEAGILTSRREGGMTFFQANERSPIFPELRGLLRKTAGLIDVLREALVPLGKAVAIAFVYGSVASGTEQPESDIDLLVVGAAPPAKLALALRQAQGQLSREIHTKAYSREEFASKRASRDHFLTRVLESPRLYVIGSADELEEAAR
ncbi:MAG TPA: nucleotidyltransferase domain-containing protein [Thermoanaerobaculia bacterium]